MTTTICKTTVMHRAWAIFKASCKNWIISFASCLKQAWREAKETLRISLMSVEEHLEAVKTLKYNLWIEENNDSLKHIQAARGKIEPQIKAHTDAIRHLNYAF